MTNKTNIELCIPDTQGGIFKLRLVRAIRKSIQPHIEGIKKKWATDEAKRAELDQTLNFLEQVTLELSEQTVLMNMTITPVGLNLLKSQITGLKDLTVRLCLIEETALEWTNFFNAWLNFIFNFLNVTFTVYASAYHEDDLFIDIDTEIITIHWVSDD